MDRLEAKRTVYSTRRWQDLRRLMVEAAGYYCEGCGRRHRSKWLVVHHIRRIRDGCDPFDPANLRVLCTGCHGKMHKGQKHPASTFRKPRLSKRLKWLRDLEEAA